jgi:hypothetical protein
MPAPAPIQYPRTDAIAKALDVSHTAVRRWRKKGMPNTSIAAAREWVAANKPRVGRRQVTGNEELVMPLVSLPENEDPQAVVQRLRTAEKTIAGSINAWVDIALPQALAEREKAKGKALIEAERKVTIINHKIEVLRREQRQAVSALLDAEGDVVKLERARGKLVTLDEAKEMSTKNLLPLIIEIRKLPDMAESERERSRLAAKAEALLAILRQSLTSHVQSKWEAAYGPEGENENAERLSA